MTRRLLLNLVLPAALLAACGGDKAGNGEDWSDRPLTAVQDTVKGVAFSIALPDKFKKEDPKSHGSDLVVSWQSVKDDNFSEPHVNVYSTVAPPEDLATAFIFAMIDKKHTIVRKEAIADGFIISHHNKNKGYVKTHVWKKRGDKVLNCVASQAKTGGVPSPGKTIKWLEKVCLSLTLKG